MELRLICCGCGRWTSSGKIAVSYLSYIMIALLFKSFGLANGHERREESHFAFEYGLFEEMCARCCCFFFMSINSHLTVHCRL